MLLVLYERVSPESNRIHPLLQNRVAIFIVTYADRLLRKLRQLTCHIIVQSEQALLNYLKRGDSC